MSKILTKIDSESEYPAPNFHAPALVFMHTFCREPAARGDGSVLDAK